jgi:SNF2 family DNA or RNA helicase
MESQDNNVEENYGFDNWNGKLKKHQEECVEDVLSCLKDGFTPIITSLPGSGKTVKSAVAMLKYGIEKLMVIAPKAAKIKWGQALEKLFQDGDYMIYTYEELRSGKTPFLKKIPNDNKKEKDNFVLTENWTELTKKYKTGIIVDEFHRLQKISRQTLALSKLLRYIFTNSRPVSEIDDGVDSNLPYGRVISISYTPCDQTNDLINQLYSFGYIQEYNSEKLNILHFIKYMENVKKMGIISPSDHEKVISNARKIFMRTGKSGKNSKLNLVSSVCYRHVLPKLTFFSIPDYVKNKSVKPDCGNLMYEVDEKTAKRINNIFEGTVEILGDGKGTRIVKKTRKTVKFITGEVECEKVPIYMKLAKFYLENTDGKVIIMVLHLESLAVLVLFLSKYGVSKLEGKMNPLEREESIRKFQKNDNNVRVMIATIYTGNESVDFHDISPGGKFPRYLLIPPCYYTKAVVQSTGRVYRNGVTSKPIIRIVYTTYQNKSLEKKYYESLETKTGNISKYHNINQKNDLPCDYPRVKV